MKKLVISLVVIAALCAAACCAMYFCGQTPQPSQPVTASPEPAPEPPSTPPIALVPNDDVVEEKLADIIMDGKIFNFKPGMLVRDLGLLHPQGWCYRQTATYGHFGRNEFPWEKTDRVEALREAAGWHP